MPQSSSFQICPTQSVASVEESWIKTKQASCSTSSQHCGRVRRGHEGGEEVGPGGMEEDVPCEVVNAATELLTLRSACRGPRSPLARAPDNPEAPLFFPVGGSSGSGGPVRHQIWDMTHSWLPFGGGVSSWATHVVILGCSSIASTCPFFLCLCAHVGGLDNFCVACAEAGVLGSRGFASENAVTQICRAGRASVPMNMMISDWTCSTHRQLDARRVEVGVAWLLVWRMANVGGCHKCRAASQCGPYDRCRSCQGGHMPGTRTQNYL